MGPAIRALRRLIYCGEWIESHALHVFMLHVPEALGYDSAIAMARDHREVVGQGLAIKKAGNEILRTIGGREIHPVSVRVGGFTARPGRASCGRWSSRSSARASSRSAPCASPASWRCPTSSRSTSTSP